MIKVVKGDQMISIAIVEDDKIYCEKLADYLISYSEERNVKLKLSVFSDGEDIVTNYKSEFDIILMDVKMTFLDGMRAAEKIRKVDKDVVIIFITSTPQYAIQGYTVDALDYLLKPVSYFALSERLDRAIDRMRQRTDKQYLMISVKGGFRKLDLSQLRYVEIWDHNLTFHMVGEDIETKKGSIRDLEKNLDGKKFFRCNKCYLINLEYVDSLQNNDVTLGKDVVRVSRAKKKELMDALNDYYNEVSK